MCAQRITFTFVPLVAIARLPNLASARTRTEVPPGYGVREQCVPFTAASALGVLIPSPIRFGLCRPDELPAGSRTLRSPVEQMDAAGRFADTRLFYVFDDPDCSFFGNAYELTADPRKSCPFRGREPGLSFFDRKDQQNLFKLHLPYIWRTPLGLDCLFMPPLNRSSRGFGVACGLVETDWYASPINLVLGKPLGSSVHVAVGDPLAQAVLVPRSLRRSALEVAETPSQVYDYALRELAEWDQQIAEDRSAYKILARSRHGSYRGQKRRRFPQRTFPGRVNASEACLISEERPWQNLQSNL